MKNDDSWQDRLAALRSTMGPTDDATSQPPQPISEPPARTAPLEVVLDRKGRAGKTATIICGFTIGDDEVAEIASRLKRALGAGGSCRGGEILVQGDRRADVVRWLLQAGYKVRGAGTIK